MPFPYSNYELGGVDQFLFQTLTANAALLALLAPQPAPSPVGIFSELAPEGAVPPFIVLGMLSSPDRNVIGADARSFTRPLYLLRAVTTGPSFAAGEAIAKQIDNSLLGARGNITGENIGVISTFRIEMIRYVEILEGVRWNHVGSRWRLFAQSLN